MEQEDMVLNLHGECPFKGDVTIWNAESEFLPILATLSRSFPRLRNLSRASVRREGY